MKSKKKIIFKLILILILILIILFIIIFFSKNSMNIDKFDDFLFIKIFSNGISQTNNIENNKNEKIYNFKISYKNLDFKSLNLVDTIDKNTLIYEKIAPGTSGSFDILLYSNQNLKYRIEFHSINDKPKNLKFMALKNNRILEETNTLEELSRRLVGYINKDENINITIKWYWNYEDKKNEEATDIQDTKDSEKIKKYQFDVYALGEEII